MLYVYIGISSMVRRNLRKDQVGIAILPAFFIDDDRERSTLVQGFKFVHDIALTHSDS